jgi:hypothetical protein
VNTVAWPDGLHLNPEGAVLFASALAKKPPERVVTHDSLNPRLFREDLSILAFPVRVPNRES